MKAMCKPSAKCPTTTSETCSNPSGTRCRKARSKKVPPPLLNLHIYFSLRTFGYGANDLLSPAIHELTDLCWKKCVTGGISSSTLDRKEGPCIQNCVERFLDANEAIVKHLGVMREQGGV